MNACDCVDQINKRISESHGVIIATGCIVNLETHKEKGYAPKLKLERVQKSRKPVPALWAKFCPFCGGPVFKETP